VSQKKEDSMKKRILVGVNVLVFLMLSFGVMGAGASDKYPSRPVELVCAFQAGGSGDISTRTWGRYLEKYLGVTIVPVNKPGAGGVIATTYVANARPDGYVLGNFGDFVINGILLGQATYKMEDLRYIAEVGRVGCVLAVAGDAPWKTFKEFLDYVKANPGTKFANQGVSTIIYMRMQTLNKHAGLKMIGVPLKGDGEIAAAVMGKHIPAGTFSASVAQPLASAGKLRILFSFDPPEDIGIDPSIPDLAGVFGKEVPDLDASTYLVAPGKTPKDIAETLEKAMEKVANDRDFVKDLKKYCIGVRYVPGRFVMEEKIPKKMPIIKQMMQEAGLIK
jgi:tripartite-type tricarboxylate transporter receptor subunit TctC